MEILKKETGSSDTRSWRISAMSSVCTSPVTLHFIRFLQVSSDVILMILFVDHERALQAGDGNSEELLAAKKKIVQLIAKISELGDALNSNESMSM